MSEEINKRVVVHCTEDEHRRFKAMAAVMGLQFRELLNLLMDAYDKNAKPKEAA